MTDPYRQLDDAYRAQRLVDGQDRALRASLREHGLLETYEKNEAIVREFEQNVRVMFIGDEGEAFTAARAVARTALEVAYARQVVKRTLMFALERAVTKVRVERQPDWPQPDSRSLAERTLDRLRGGG